MILSAQERRKHILHLAAEHGDITIERLQPVFQVSEVTLRRDLDILESQGHIRRVRGGAVLNSSPQLEVRFQEKLERFVTEKREIARTAASMVNEGQVVMLSGGTTTMYIARELTKNRDVTVVTPAINIAAELAGYDNVTLIMIGGIVRKNSYVAAGHIADESLSGMNADFAFVGVDGVDATAGFTTPNLVESRTDATMLKSATNSVIVADRSKLGVVAFSPIAKIDEPSMFLTDSGAPEDSLSALRLAGCNVLTSE